VPRKSGLDLPEASIGAACQHLAYNAAVVVSLVVVDRDRLAIHQAREMVFGYLPKQLAFLRRVDASESHAMLSLVESATVGAKDTYGFADMVRNPASVFGVQINLNVKKDDAGFRQVKDVVRSGGADFAGTAQAVSTSYGYKSAIRETNPATGAPWTKAGVNAAEFGMEVA
jgi:hypothetical protein